MKLKIINSILFFIFIIPIVILCIWTITARWPWPLLFPTHFSLRGAEEILRQSERLRKSVFSSMVISCTVAVISTIISLLTARAAVRSEGGLNKYIKLTLSLPFIIPVTVFATGIHQKMIQWGLSNTVGGIILTHLVYSLPYASFIILEAYQALGIKQEEQAWLLGANHWQAFVRIALPQLTPVMFTSLAMAYIVSFSQYFLTLMIGGGQVQTLSILIFPYLQSNDRTIASNYSLLFLVITLLVMGIFSLLSKWIQRNYQPIKYY
ncbi:ABC transporter permease subunit [Facklamia sp. DSM 111018]|uniref:ABC transporter permease subunit n=1 Tax=Facklamia lactis TaxID=2749967 RepID=A0ABS0LPM6_9LACT|nr:ABC transporter permease subunit [Facklamia lactis]MBG9986084.1 ABC transporter permease subunit [Facklamia lactis]